MYALNKYMQTPRDTDFVASVRERDTDRERKREREGETFYRRENVKIQVL